MAPQRPRYLVYCFVLPRPLIHSAELALVLGQMIAHHSGFRGGVTIKASLDRRALRVFTTSEARVETLRLAIDTNREDWRNAGVTEIRPAA